MTSPVRPIGEDDLQAWLDGRLLPDRQAEMEAYLSAHPDVAERLAAYRAQGPGLVEALRTKYEEPVPARLRVDAMLDRRRRRWASAMSRAAAVILIASLGVVGGWWGRDWAVSDRLHAATGIAVAAYRTFVTDPKHPVEVRADEGAKLVAWLSSRLDRPLTPPDLAALGWRLMGGRVLPTAGVPAAQLMYDDDHGTRLTVYVQPMGIDGEEFRYSQQGDVRTIVWAERRMALAVTGKVSRDSLLAVANRVRETLE